MAVWLKAKAFTVGLGWHSCSTLWPFSTGMGDEWTTLVFNQQLVSSQLARPCMCKPVSTGKSWRVRRDTTWYGATVSFRLHPSCHWFQLLPSPVIVILTPGDPTYTAVGDPAFPIARSCLWNSLLADVTSASTLNVFHNRLKLTSVSDHFLLTVFGCQFCTPCIIVVYPSCT